jgi:tetratricopeptide (TPR) repeat protein
LQDLNKAVAVNPRNSQLYYERAEIYVKMDRLENALADYNKAIDLKEHPFYYNNRGFVRAELGFYKEALEDYDKALLLDPGYTAAQQNRRIITDRIYRC